VSKLLTAEQLNQAASTLADDLLFGVQAIADYTGQDYRSTWHKIQHPERFRFPFVRKAGQIWSRKSWLEAWYSGETVEVPASDPPVKRGPAAKAEEPDAADAETGMLTCRSCDKLWPDPHRRGRKPTHCDDCKAAGLAPRSRGR
jgi:hypothetical protein